MAYTWLTQFATLQIDKRIIWHSSSMFPFFATHVATASKITGLECVWLIPPHCYKVPPLKAVSSGNIVALLGVKISVNFVLILCFDMCLYFQQVAVTFMEFFSFAKSDNIVNCKGIRALQYFCHSCRTILCQYLFLSQTVVCQLKERNCILALVKLCLY